MNSVLTQSIPGQTGSSLFVEVNHNEKLGLSNDEQLRLFHLRVSNSAFNFDQLGECLQDIVSEYVFSRAQIENLKVQGNVNSIGLRALRIMKKNGKPNQKGTGNELGELLLYLFLERYLKAPKLFSKVELNAIPTTRWKESDAIHLLQLPGQATPSYQTVYGSSNIRGDIKDAIDSVFQSIGKIKCAASQTGISLADSTVFEQSFDEQTAKEIINIMIPQAATAPQNDMAFGVFLGYSLGLDPNNWNNQSFLQTVDAKMQTDIKHHASYFASKIKSLNLQTHSFYVYLLPFNNAEIDKQMIMENLMM